MTEPVKDLGDLLDPGTILAGGLRIERVLGVGGLGALYRAYDGQSDQPVALRILKPEIAADDQAVEALRAAVEALAPLEHKNLVKPIGFGRDGDRVYLVQELLDGQGLRVLLDRKKQAGNVFTVKGAFNIVAHVCHALDFLREKGEIHGALHPNNVLVTKGGRIRVSDAGLVRRLGAVPDALDWLAPTGMDYVAPEVQANPAGADERADVYSVGALTQELLTGVAPSEATAPPSRVRPELPAQVDAVLSRAMSVSRDERFLSVVDFKESLLDVIQQGARMSSTSLRAVSSSMGAVTGGSSASAAGDPAGGGTDMDIDIDVDLEPPAAPGVPEPGPVTSGEFDLASLVAETSGEDEERYLVQIDKMDYGPFSMRDVKVQIRTGKASGNDLIVDMETGERVKIADHPVLGLYYAGVERHRELQRRAEAASSTQESEKKKRGIFIGVTIGALALVGLVVGAVFLYKGVTKGKKKPSRRAGKELSYDVSWDGHDGKRGRGGRHRRHRGRGGWSGGKWSDRQELDLGSGGGGGQTLSRSQIYSVMSRYNQRIGRCLLKYGLSKVTIRLQIAGSGRLTAVRTTASGAADSCVKSAVRSAKFPSFSAPRTTGSYTLRVQ